MSRDEKAACMLWCARFEGARSEGIDVRGLKLVNSMVFVIGALGLDLGVTFFGVGFSPAGVVDLAGDSWDDTDDGAGDS